MARILVLGGSGFTGKLIARHLLEQSSAEVCLGARNLEKLRAYGELLKSEFGSERVSSIHADAASTESMRRALRDMDLLVVASPTSQHTEAVVRASLDSGTDYLDVQLSARKLAVLKTLTPAIESAGRCCITEAGFHPGLPAVMARYAALHLDRLDTATISGYVNMGMDLPLTEAADEFMEVFKDFQSQVYRKGSWGNTGGYETRTVNFGGDIGSRKCYSMYFEELARLPEMYPTLTELGFYIAGTQWFVDWVLTPLLMAGLKVAPHIAGRPLGRLLWWGMRTLAKPPYLALVRVDASGMKSGKPATVSACASHPDGYELTAIPVVAALLQYLDGSARKPGLWMMGHLVEPARLLRDMESMGVKVSISGDGIPATCQSEESRLQLN